MILTDRTRLYVSDDPAKHPFDADQVDRVIALLQAAGKQVIVIADPPEMSAVPPQGGGSAADCLEHASSPSDCSLPRTEAAFDDPVTAGAEAAGARVLDFSDVFCLPDRCLSRIGGVVVYSDDNHMSRSFALSLREILGTRLDAALASAR